MTTRGSAGHVLPLAPFGHACLRAGHDVLVAAQRQHEGNVVRAGLAFAPVAEPPDDQWMPLLADFAQLGIDESNARMLGEYFAQHDTRAALPGLRAIVERWQPDIIVRESWEYASTPAVERLLGEVSYRRAAERIAAAMRGLPPVDAAVDVLAAIARQPAAEKRAA